MGETSQDDNAAYQLWLEKNAHVSFSCCFCPGFGAVNLFYGENIHGDQTFFCGNCGFPIPS